jgi:CRISPR-associated protein Csd1
MSWLSNLYATYEKAQQLDISDDLKPLPISHTLQNAHIKLTLDLEGNFKRAEVLEKIQIVLPSTEASAGRSGQKPPPHPLADKIQYVAKDYPIYGGTKPSFFNEYFELLSNWCISGFAHEQVLAVKTYVEKGAVVADLIKSGVLFVDAENKLLTTWPKESNAEPPKIFKVLPKEAGILDQGSALVCWNVEDARFVTSETWLNPDIQSSWIQYDSQTAGQQGLCYITGKVMPLASNHPAKLRHTGDKAKLISSNDSSGFTFRGRFTDATGDQAASVAYDVTQKSHNALRWLISRQGYRNGDQAVVAWALSCEEIPDPMTMSFDLLMDEDSQPVIDHSIDIGKKFGLALKKYIAGYKAKLDHSDSVIIIGLDSATPGRMGVTYYQEFMPEEYLSRIEKWHQDFAWFQRVKQEINGKEQTTWPISTPAPKSIYEAIFGSTISDSLKKQTIERILPCIVEGVPFPKDLMQGAVRRAINRQAYKKNEEWEETLGIACALFKGFKKRHIPSKEYEMGLEKENSSRDYLFGRLLAIAEKIEETALYVAGENRSTTAARLMQRFADRPFSTWRNIELALNPYIQRLKVTRGGFLHNIQIELDEVMGMFNSTEFNSDKSLSGEFLLAFHAQRLELKKRKEDTPDTQTNSDQ